MGASLTIQAADATSLQMNQARIDKLRNEMMENGIESQEIENLIEYFSSVDTSSTSLDHELRGLGSAREARNTLNNDRERKSRIGWGLVDMIMNQTAFPLKIDESTWYTGLHYDGDYEALVYHYTITNRETLEIFKENVEAVRCLLYTSDAADE